MDAFVAYSIPIQGLKVGLHHFKYAVDSAFFRHFEGSPIQEGSVHFDVQFDKRADMIVLDFELKGYTGVECDRCTAPIKLPLESEHQLILKYTDAEGIEEDEEDDEVVFIPREMSSFNVAKYLYEFAVLALPITNTYNCQDDPEPPCNFEILKFLDKNPGKDDSSSVWDALNGLKEQ